MEYITTKDASTGEEVEISYKDYGQGRPVVLIHGWPLSKEMWEYQLDDLINAGLRVIKYDRRGFGKSSKPWNSYDYDTLTDDLNAIMEQLELRDAILVGFSMGGGEAVRYLSRYGRERVSKLVLISAVTPYLGKSSDNPEGVDESVFAGMMKQMKEDRIEFLDAFGKLFLVLIYLIIRLVRLFWSITECWHPWLLHELPSSAQRHLQRRILEEMLNL